MNSKTIARHYGILTPEERFCLILAASGRGDEAETERLARAGPKITFSVRNHWPYSMAFQELTWLTFIEFLEEASGYLDANRMADDAFANSKSDVPKEDDAEDAPEIEEETTGSAEGQGPEWQRALRLVYATGFMFRTKYEGWKLFCERLNIPPFLLWEGLPGLDRIQRARALAEKAAFTPDGFLYWVNTVRPPGEPELIENKFTVERVADATEKMFRQRVEGWS